MHSHTEHADRLFSLLKRLFATDDPSRPEGIGCVPELWARIHAVFSNTVEGAELAWNLANWDFDEWFTGMHRVGQFSRMSAVQVYVYEYDESLWRHGVVKVTFKERLSAKGTACEA